MFFLDVDDKEVFSLVGDLLFQTVFFFKGNIRATILSKSGAPERIRTTNLLIRSQMLYPVELRAPERESVNLRSNGRTVKS